MTNAEITAALHRSLNVHRAELEKLAHTLLGQGHIVADAHVRTVHDAGQFGGEPGRLALAPASDDLCGTLHFARRRAEQVAASFCAQGQQVEAIHVTDWHRRRITALESALQAWTEVQPAA